VNVKFDGLIYRSDVYYSFQNISHVKAFTHPAHFFNSFPINIFNDFIEVSLTTVNAAYPLNNTECVEWHNKYRQKHQVNNFFPRY